MTKTDRYYKQYQKEIEKDPDAYASYEDFLGANGLVRCEDCNNVVEYDEVNEIGHCFDCQPEDEDEGE